MDEERPPRASVPLHPLALALFPILALAAQNLAEVALVDLVRPTVVVLGLSLGAWALARLALGGWRKAALLLSLVLLLVFTYGPYCSALGGLSVEVAGVVIGPKKIAFVIWALLFAVATLLIARASVDLRRLTSASNVMAAVLMGVALLHLCYAATQLSGERTTSIQLRPLPCPQLSPAEAARLPDIYYIVLDGYGRSDVLREIHGYDNGAFVEHLRDRGFFVADRSHANYPQTALSLGSSLNLAYVQDLWQHAPGETSDRSLANALVLRNRLVDFLRHYGYRFVAFASGYRPTSFRESDEFLAPTVCLTEFEKSLLGITPFPPLVVKLRWLLGAHADPYEQHREMVQFTLEHLADPASQERPVFVLAHVICPHPPFVFRADGTPRTPSWTYCYADGSGWLRVSGASPEQYVEGYRQQIAYLTSQVRSALDDILARSARPPVIIVQGDHGPGSRLDHQSVENTDARERLAILNAVHLPGLPEGVLYPTISPVNTFRVVLDRYFHTELGLLEDRSYLCTWDRPYRYHDRTEQLLPERVARRAAAHEP